MRHAYLIMAHTDFKILEKSILLLDSEFSDFYIHIDRKVKNFDFEYFKNLPKKSNIYFVKRINVSWASFSQIKCEYILFKEAHKKHYDYYHLLSGSDLPIVSNKVIYDFFEENNGREFVLLDNHNSISDSAIERIKYYHFFVNFARSKSNFLRRVFGLFNYQGINIQRKLKVNRLKKLNIDFRKGANWVSITHNFVSYVLSKEKFINHYYRYSYCADELFIQTLLYNSQFYKKVYSKQDDDYEGIKRCIDWKRGEPYTFKSEDFEFLIKSNCFFARKFSTDVDNKIIEKIFQYVRGEDNG
ncbi:MAG: glycosyl transferase [Bacilli bacterium]|nr:glycosyl transferase [Bacilli bacterium]